MSETLMTADLAARVERAADAAVRCIPPVFPLAATVAVNPFLGQAGMGLADTAALLARVGGVRVAMPRAWHVARMARGGMNDADLAAALAAAPAAAPRLDLAALKAALWEQDEAPQALPTIASLAATVSGIDWPGVIADRIGAWAAGYFDQGQALWAAPRLRTAYEAWRAYAVHDLTPEILGLRGFAGFVSEAVEHAGRATRDAVAQLAVPEAALGLYFHRLLMTLGGWAQLGRHALWQAELAGGTDEMARALLAIRLVWETALYRQYADKISAAWQEALQAYAAPVVPTRGQYIDAILQDAAERAAQRQLNATLTAARQARGAVAVAERPDMQAVFCIDVRSEVFRRALESVHPGIRTMGFAGFFGVTAQHRRFASDVAEHRLPVLLNAGVRSCAGVAGPADQESRFKARAKRAWGRFKLAAVSSFAFVEASGPLYVAKLLRDALGGGEHGTEDEPMPVLTPEPDRAARARMAETVLRAMSLTSNFARLVLLAGHGAAVVNNPFASALQCGACGGYSGEANARLLAALLNDLDVRADLVAAGIVIPDDTLFVAGLHDTASDQVRLYSADAPAAAHRRDLTQAKAWLAQAGRLARTERAQFLPGAREGRAVLARGRDWAEVRPEWGLAGCSSFLAMPRAATSGRDLQGRAFLHDYDWRQDEGFGVLELILTAPVVVASWISLQYYGSAVAPEVFGSGNKLLHNVVGGSGVVEGNGGVLRTGLPWQSVHDGENFRHEPLRLTVCVAAPKEAMSAILARHDGVRALFDNGWLHLFAVAEDGRLAWRYRAGLQWEAEKDGMFGDLAARDAA